MLQAEAEILATELEEAAEEGIGAELVQDVEDTVESAAEALLARIVDMAKVVDFTPFFLRLTEEQDGC